MDSMLPFLAPWTALLTVHATMHRSLSRGAHTTVASTIGVGLSFLIGAYLGVNVWTFALALFVGLAGARLSWIRDESVAIATTAIFILGSGFSEQQPLLLDRIIEVGVGMAIGGPRQPADHSPAARSAGRAIRGQHQPSHGRRPHQHGRRVLHLLGDRQGDAWRQETESMSEELDTAWQSAYSEGDWDERFRERWRAIVRDAEHAIAGPDANVRSDLRPHHRSRTGDGRRPGSPRGDLAAVRLPPVEHAPHRRRR
nr:FUSC family protein [Brachybacterium fresconis]